MFTVISTEFYELLSEAAVGRKLWGLFDLIRFSLPNMLAALQGNILLASWKTSASFCRRKEKQTGGPAPELHCSRNDRGKLRGFRSGIQRGVLTAAVRAYRGGIGLTCKALGKPLPPWAKPPPPWESRLGEGCKGLRAGAVSYHMLEWQLAPGVE